MTFKGHGNRPRTPLSESHGLCCNRPGRGRKADANQPSLIRVCHASLAEYSLAEPFAGGGARQSADAGLSQ